MARARAAGRREAVLVIRLPTRLGRPFGSSAAGFADSGRRCCWQETVMTSLFWSATRAHHRTRWTMRGASGTALVWRSFDSPTISCRGLRLLLEAELPDIQGALSRAGAAKFDLLNPLPPSIRDQSARPIDDKLWTLTARRPVGEWVFADAAQREPRISFRRGVTVGELIAGSPVMSGTPHVAGVRTSEGDEIRATLVVDATGRQSRAGEWPTTIGASRPVEDQADSGFVYYTRYFRGLAPQRLAPVLSPLGTISLLTIPGDNGTWSVTIFAATGDEPLKSLRHDVDLDKGRARLSAPRTLAGWRADWRCARHGGHRRPLSSVRQRRSTHRDGFCGSRRRLGLHVPIRGTRA